MIVSAIVIALLLVFAGIFVKQRRYKDLILKVFAVITVIIHFSTLYVDYFSTGAAEIESPMILPIYPCNIAMWLLLIVAFYRNKDSKVFKILAEITFYLGIIGGVFGIVFNEIYASTPSLAVYDTLNGLLSHDTMLFGCLYLLVGKYVKIRVSNLISIAIGLVLLFVDGWVIICLYKIFKLSPPNSMFLLEPPLPELPWFNTYVIGALAIVLFFGITALYEQIALKKEDRWYYKLKNRRNK